MKKLVSLVAVVVLSASAFAGNKDKAETLFKQGKKLMTEKKYSEACSTLEQSMKLDPGIGTQLNIAKCYEEWGRIGHALIAYQAAEKMAKDASDKRAPQIQEIVDGLDSQVPRLTIKLPKDAKPEGVKVQLDNEPVESLGTALIIDPGPHTIDYTIDDGAKKSKIVPVERGGDSEVTLDVPKDRVAKGDKGGKGAGDGGGKKVEGGGGTKGGGEREGGGGKETAAAPGRNMRIGGLVLGGAGVIAIGVSSIMTLSARGQYNDALNMYCMGMKNMCDPMGLQLTHDARSTANTATIVFLVGTAAVGGGVALYLLAPKHAASSAKGETGEESARYIVPAVSKDGGGVVFGGNF